MAESPAFSWTGELCTLPDPCLAAGGRHVGTRGHGCGNNSIARGNYVYIPRRQEVECKKTIPYLKYIWGVRGSLIVMVTVAEMKGNYEAC